MSAALSIPTQTRSMPTILVVDDEAPIRRAILRALGDEPYRRLEASSGDEALAILAREPVHVILSDHNMPGMCGLDLLRMVRLRHPSVVRLMITANDEFDVAVRAINLGEVSRFLRKPFDDEELVCSVRQAFDTAAVERELKKLRERARRTVDEMKALEKVYPGIGVVRRDRAGAIEIGEEFELSSDGSLAADAIWRD